MDKPHIAPTPCRNARGFTMIELLVTLVILGILIGVALPAFRSFIVGQRIKNTSFEIMAMLTLTRSEAIKRNSNVTAAPVSNDWTQGWTVTSAGGTVINRQSALPGGSITISCFTGTPPLAIACSPIVYNASGRITGSAQSIQITSTGTISSDGTGLGARCISIDLSGRPNSKKGTC